MIRILFVFNILASCPVIKPPAAHPRRKFIIDGWRKTGILKEILRMGGKYGCKNDKRKKLHVGTYSLSLMLLHWIRVDEKTGKRSIFSVVGVSDIEVVPPENVRGIYTVSLPILTMSIKKNNVQPAGMPRNRPSTSYRYQIPLKTDLLIALNFCKYADLGCFSRQPSG